MTIREKIKELADIMPEPILEKTVELWEVIQKEKQSDVDTVDTPDPEFMEQIANKVMKDRAIALRMRNARDAMPPLGLNIKDLVEEGREH